MAIHLTDHMYHHTPCLCFSNGVLRLSMPKLYGPRILFFGFIGGPNFFGLSMHQRKTPYGIWKIYGGHRLWIAPEQFPDTYYPDNKPIQWNYHKGVLNLIQDIPELGFSKKMHLSFIGPHNVRVVHEVQNHSTVPKECSLWAISLVAKKGIAILPQSIKKEDRYGARPTHHFVRWPYTDAHERTIQHKDALITIRQGSTAPAKIGQRITRGWCGYALKESTLIKRFPFDPNAHYPDLGCNVEIFNCKEFLEVETLSPLVSIAPASSYTYEEVWEVS